MNLEIQAKLSTTVWPVPESLLLDGLCAPCRTKVNFKSKVALQSNGSDDFQNIMKNFIMLVIHNDKNRLGKILRTHLELV